MFELLDLVFPPRCLACGAGGDVLCVACAPRLPLLVGPVCTRCGSPAGERCVECAQRSLAFASAKSAVAYRRDIARALSAWKEGGAWRLTRVAAAIVAEIVPRPQVEALTSVPPDRDRALWRGHDPAAALARALGQTWGLPFRRMLRRRPHIAAQKTLDATERKANVAGTFHAPRRVPRNVALIDDVYTTGAIASAAAQALRDGGAAKVEVVTFARALRTHGEPARRGRGLERLR